MKRKEYVKMSETEIKGKLVEILADNKSFIKIESSKLQSLAKKLGFEISTKTRKFEICEMLVGKLNLQTLETYEKEIIEFGISLKELPNLFGVSANTMKSALERYDINPDAVYESRISGKKYTCYAYKSKKVLEISKALEMEEKEHILISEKQKEKNKIVKKSITKCIPKVIENLYPEARKLKRKFILHIGPTNSGKTYEAISDMVKIGSGVYLGPLRLLAFERFEAFKDMGLKCNLVTGEEKVLIDDAKFQASTIEMLDTSIHYSCAVIDEAQMIGDEYRGGKWTNAILGLKADKIHICASPEAEDLLIKLIEKCGDEFEVKHHDRLCPLEYDNQPFIFPDSAKKGDALIAFSRRTVHAIAAELQKRGIKCSVIYGALPYDVRHEEARKFTSGETEVLVATDAIGMGLNLPIKRVILMEASKFDGTEIRKLNPSEIKQIVGRAGRAGIYDIGYYGIDNEIGSKAKKIKKAVDKQSNVIEKARIDFPQNLIDVDEKLSVLIKKWEKKKISEEYEKSSTERLYKLADLAEKITEDKKTIYEAITIPFDEKDREFINRWEEVLIDYCKGRNVSFYCTTIINHINNENELEIAERKYKALDLEYQLCSRFGDEKSLKEIMHSKNIISKAISIYLANCKFKERKCSNCGKKIMWNSRYKYCNGCWEEMHSNYYDINRIMGF